MQLILWINPVGVVRKWSFDIIPVESESLLLAVSNMLQVIII
jgi:hypothetical protein